MDQDDDKDEIADKHVDAKDSDDDGIPDAVRRRLETFVPELVRRTFAAGLGAVFTTEEGIRKITKEIPQAKDVVDYVTNTAGSTKDEVMRMMARETREFLQTVNFSEEIAKMLTMLSFEIKTEIRFIPNDEKYGGVEPDVKAKVRFKKNRKSSEGTDEEGGSAGETKASRSSKGRRRRLTLRRADTESEDGENNS